MGIIKGKVISSLVLSAILFSLVYAQPGTWSEPVNISNTDGRSDFQAMAVGPDETIHVVWSDDSRIPGNDPYEDDILYSCYDGLSWSEPVMLSGYDTTYSYRPRIAVDSFGKPHVVWNHRAIFPDADVYYTMLTDSGWMEPIILSTISTSYAPDIAIDSEDNIHVVWSDYIYGNGEILYIYNDGDEWSDYVNVSNDPITSGKPEIAIDYDGKLHVIWQEYAEMGIQCEVFYSYFDGISWSQGLNISQNPDYTSSHPTIAVDNENNPHVAWSQITQWGTLPVIEEIYYSTQNDNIWSLPENISNQGLRCDYPELAINSNNVKCLLYKISIEQNIDFKVNFSYCENSIWSSPEILIPLYNSMLSDICIDSEGILHCVISVIDIPLYSDICYMRNESFNAVEIKLDTELRDFSFNIYPNPFNLSSQITFKLAVMSDVELSIYNIQGKLVKAYINETLPPGSYVKNWNASGLSSGIYFISLESSGMKQVKKAVLMK